MIHVSLNEKVPIGSKVLSKSFGIGIISAIKKLQENGIEYYVIQCENKKLTNYYPVIDNKKIRAISSKKDFKNALAKLKKNKRSITFESKKDRQLYFDQIVDNSQLNLIIKRISNLNTIKKQTPREQKILSHMIETLEIEASTLFEMDKKESKEFILKFIN